MSFKYRFIYHLNINQVFSTLKKKFKTLKTRIIPQIRKIFKIYLKRRNKIASSNYKIIASIGNKREFKKFKIFKKIFNLLFRDLKFRQLLENQK